MFHRRKKNTQPRPSHSTAATVQNVEAVPTTSPDLGPTLEEIQTPQFVHLVQRAHESISRLQKERISEDELDEKGKRVLEEVRQLLVALQSFTQTKKMHVLIKSLFSHMSLLADDVRQDRNLGMHLLDWRSAYFSLDSESHSLLNQIYQVASSLRKTRTVFGILAGGLRLLEHFLTSNTEDEAMQDALFGEFIALLRALNHNAQWRTLVLQSRAISSERILRTGRPRIKISERPGFAELEQDLSQILESLVGESGSVHVAALFANAKTFMNEIQTNPQHAEFVRESQELLHEIAESPDILEDPEARLILFRIYKSALNILRDMRAHPNLQAAKRELSTILGAINSDPAAKSVLQQSTLLVKELLQNDKKHLIDYSLVSQFRRILVPLIIETFREIKIPPIKGVTSKKNMKYHVHGLVLSSIELLPENIKIETTYKINTDPLHLSTHEHDTILWVEIERVRAHVKGTAWSYEKLNFPKLRDEGLASVSLGGYGGRVGLKLRISRQGGNILQVLDSYCVIDRLDVALYECNHKFLYKLLHHYIVRNLKNTIEQSVSDKLGQCVAMVDHRLVAGMEKTKRQREAMNLKVDKVKAVLAKPQNATKESITARVRSPSTKRRVLNLVTLAKQSAEARAPPYYQPPERTPAMRASYSPSSYSFAQPTIPTTTTVTPPLSDPLALSAAPSSFTAETIPTNLNKHETVLDAQGSIVPTAV